MLVGVVGVLFTPSGQVVPLQVLPRSGLGPVVDLFFRVVDLGKPGAGVRDFEAVEPDHIRLIQPVHDAGQVLQVSSLPAELLPDLVGRE